MKKQQIYSILLVLIIVLVYPMLNQLLNSPNIPFKNLKVENIKSIDLYLQPPDKGIAIDDKNSIKDVVETLNKLVIKTDDSPNIDYNGQLVIYTLNKNNGDTVELKVCSPYVIIDEKIYKANYEICDVLNILGNDLLDTSY